MNYINKKYIRGVKGRGDEVKKVLEALGGSTKNIHGGDENNIYYINRYGIVNCLDKNCELYFVIIECFEEITLPPPAFVPKEYTVTFVTAPATNCCEGCYFDEKETCENNPVPKCYNDRIIYKLKQ